MLSAMLRVAGESVESAFGCLSCTAQSLLPTSTTDIATSAEVALTSVTELMNHELREYEPTTLIATTVAVTLGAVYALRVTQRLQEGYLQAQFYSKGELLQHGRDRALKFLQDKPLIGGYLRKKIDKKVVPLLRKLADDTARQWRPLGEMRYELPRQALSAEAILAEVKPANERDHLIKASGTMYYRPNPVREHLIKEVYDLTKLTNPMHTSEFPHVCKMKAEVIAWCQALFHGTVDAAHHKFPGMITDGGTNSISEAIRAYARHARHHKGVEMPEVVIPTSAHVAFYNAIDSYHVKLIEVPVNPHTGAADVQAMEKAITANTCLIVGSAPSFPNGVMDPIPELAAMAGRHGVPVHVDSCLGGFLTAFAGEDKDTPLCDFRVPNVMSISVDPHKYGQTPKGSSVLLFHPEAPVMPIYTKLDWDGGLYVAEGLKGSRPGNVPATTWATMLSIGQDGYEEETRLILAFTKKLAAAIREVPGVVLPYQPALSVISIATEDGVPAGLVASKLKESHWSMNMIKSGGFHFCVTAFHEEHQETILADFIRDLTAAVEYARHHPKEKPKGLEGVYGQLPEIPDFVQDRVGESYAAINNSLPQPHHASGVRPG